MSYICYVAGKSGGHIIPALSHAQHFIQEHPQTKVLFFSTASALDRSLLERNPLITHHHPLALDNMPRKNIFAWPRFIGGLVKSCWQSFALLRRYRPVKVVSMGGYVSIPVCYMAWALNIPVEVYELNVLPGRAVKALVPIAECTHICFAQTRRYLPEKALCQLSAYPLRFGEQHKLERAQAHALLDIAAHKKVLLVLGGSQGSRFINELLQKLATTMHTFFIIHQTGAADVAWVRDGYAKAGVEALVFAYRDDMHLCYSAADKVIARAGAGTLFELDFFRKESFIIPLEIKSTDHQVDNAHAFAAQNSAVKVFRQHLLMHDSAPLRDWLGLSL